ncbi:MAG TPA: tetratricopeptide repeat protein [Flavisolibacter sp.]|nr:tetratricopeptide repeat protein [Flavisolibacter sp.]
MYRGIYLLVISAVLIASCNNDESAADPLLSQQPYAPLTDSIKQFPNNATLYYRRGGLLYSNNQMAEAQHDIRTAWKLDPKEEYALSLTTILRSSNIDSAIVFIQEALKKIPNSIALQIGLARGYQQKGQADKALTIVNNILAQYPNQLDALGVKSDLLKSENKKDEALTTMEKAYKYAPNDKELSYDLAYDYATAKNPKALSLSDSLIKKDSSETVARAYYVKATYYANTGHYDDAIKNYDASITHDYNFLDSYLDKGHLLYNQKKYDAAVKVFQLALRVSPTTADFYYWLAKTQEAMGNKADAKLNYQRAYGLDKTMTEAKEGADKL